MYIAYAISHRMNLQYPMIGLADRWSAPSALWVTESDCNNISHVQQLA